VLTVCDDGVGFDPREVLERGRGRYAGIGLLSMRTHAELLHGTLAVTSAPGAGTTVEIDVPVTPR
jgi:signal transduction histidine kinase